MSSTDEQNTEEVSQPVIEGNAEASATDAVTEAAVTEAQPQPVAAEKRKKARRTTKERTGHNTRGRKTGKVASKVAKKASSTTKTRKTVHKSDYTLFDDYKVLEPEKPILKVHPDVFFADLTLMPPADSSGRLATMKIAPGDVISLWSVSSKVTIGSLQRRKTNDSVFSIYCREYNGDNADDFGSWSHPNPQAVPFTTSTKRDRYLVSDIIKIWPEKCALYTDPIALPTSFLAVEQNRSHSKRKTSEDGSTESLEEAPPKKVCRTSKQVSPTPVTAPLLGTVAVVPAPATPVAPLLVNGQGIPVSQIAENIVAAIVSTPSKQGIPSVDSQQTPLLLGDGNKNTETPPKQSSPNEGDVEEVKPLTVTPFRRRECGGFVTLPQKSYGGMITGSHSYELAAMAALGPFLQNLSDKYSTDCAVVKSSVAALQETVQTISKDNQLLTKSVLETLMHTVDKHSELCDKMLTTISADSRAAVTALHTSVDKLSDTVTAISANHRDAVGSVIRETADAAQKREEHAQQNTIDIVKVLAHKN